MSLADQLEGFIHSPGVPPVAFLLAFAAGAGHAVMLGHGKSLAAAYLVGERGRVRDAAWLGGAVAVMHTLSVLMVTVNVAAGNLSVTGTVELREGTKMRGTAPVTNGKATFTLPVGLAAGVHTLTASYPGSDTFEPALTTAGVTLNLPPAWNAKTLYKAGAKVSYQGRPYEAAWASILLAPGTAYGAWQELAMTEDGTTLWTPSRIFEKGDVVTYKDKRYQAKWWTRNQAPGDQYGPWAPIR